MKKRSILILCTVLLCAIAGIVWRLHPSPATSYKGKSLEAWVYDLNGPTPETRTAARDAVCNIGTNGLPYLLGLLRSEDSVFWLKLEPVLSRIPLIHFHYLPAFQRHRLSFFALDALATNAEPAVPELIGLLQSTNSDTRDLSAQALGSIGIPESLVVPALTNAVTDPNSRVRGSAAESLGRIGKKPDVAVPVLIDRLSATDHWELLLVMNSLGRFRADALPARAMLMPYLQSADPTIRSTASNVIASINYHSALRTKTP